LLVIVVWPVNTFVNELDKVPSSAYISAEFWTLASLTKLEKTMDYKRSLIATVGVIFQARFAEEYLGVFYCLLSVRNVHNFWTREQNMEQCLHCG